jgi:hypothetical protein
MAKTRSNDYHFITRWRVQGSAEEVYDSLSLVTELPRWWSSVYLDVQELDPGGANGIGKVVSLHTRGWLPYTLRWQLRVTEARYPHGFSIEAWGDFVGRGVWDFVQDGDFVDITYDWKIRAEKPLLRYFSFIFKPVFAANHRWAMAQGETSLRAEIARGRSTSASRS